MVHKPVLTQFAYRTQSGTKHVLYVFASWICPRADVYAPRARMQVRKRDRGIEIKKNQKSTTRNEHFLKIKHVKLLN